MAPERHTQDTSRSRHSNRSRRDRDDASSVDSGYGGSAANSPKDTHDVQKDALRDYHAESARHHAESGRRSSRSDESKAADPKAGREERDDSDSDSDYDPRDKYYLEVDDDEYNKMTSAAADDPAKDEREQRRVSDRDRSDDPDRRRSDAPEGHGSERRRNESVRDRRERRDRRESDASSTSRRSERGRDHDRERERHNSVIARRQSLTSDGSDPSERRSSRRHSHQAPARHSDTPSTRPDSQDRDRKQQRRRHDAHHHRPLSPIPSDSSDDDRDKRGSTGKSRDASSAGYVVDPDGEAAASFLDRLTRGVDMRSVGKVGLDAAAVAAIKIAVGTQVPWKQRIPRTITVGAAAAIMDFVVKKTNFKPKGMIGTIYARQFVEIVLANLIVNPVTIRVTGAAQGAKEKGKAKVAAGRPGAGGGRR